MTIFGRICAKLTATSGLNRQQQHVLTAVAAGAALRSQRDLEGNKRYELRWPDGRTEQVARPLVLSLRNRRLIETNHKFPSATFLLTERGSAIAARLTPENDNRPLGSSAFLR